MLIRHFTIQDVLSCTAAVPAFVPFLFAPGFCAGYVLDLFGFRKARWLERSALSITLSIAVVPILCTLLARYSSLLAACWLCVGTAISALILIVRDIRAGNSIRLSRSAKLGLCIFAAWTVVAIGSLVDLQIGSKLYPSATIFDQSLRSAVTSAALRTGVPPANPFFYPGHSVPMRYYYYWNVICALPAKLFGLNPRITMLTSVVWSGFGLMALIPIYLKHFCEETVDLGRKAIIGIMLLAVTGIDLIPTILFFVGQKTVLVDMEWWDVVQVTSWADSLLWVPHHVASLVALLTGFLILWVVPRNASMRERAVAAGIAGLAFASAAGFSVYVTFTFAVFLTIWTLNLFRSYLHGEAVMFIAAGMIAVIISVPYLHDLRQPGITGSFASFYVRAFYSVEDWADNTISWTWLKSLYLVAMLPVYYLVELGFFAVVGLGRGWSYVTRREPLVRWEWAAVCICGTSLLVGSFLMSTTGNNDLGYRSMLFAQFILLLWAVPYVYNWLTKRGAERGKRALIFQAFLLIGVLGTVYQLVELRMFTYLLDHSTYADEAPWLPDTDDVGEQLYNLRTGFDQLNRRLPLQSVVQYNPLNPAYAPNLFYALRQSVVGHAACGTAFGGEPFECLPYQRKVMSAFNGRKSFSIVDADLLCDELGIAVLIAERSDRMWSLKNSWVWTGVPVVANTSFRAIPCGAHRDDLRGRFSAAR